MTNFRLSIFIFFYRSVFEWDGESLEITRISRLDMGAYLCIGEFELRCSCEYFLIKVLIINIIIFQASNSVPPSVSKRIKVSVDCKYFFGKYMNDNFIIELFSKLLSCFSLFEYWFFLMNKWQRLLIVKHNNLFNLHYGLKSYAWWNFVWKGFQIFSEMFQYLFVFFGWNYQLSVNGIFPNNFVRIWFIIGIQGKILSYWRSNVSPFNLAR